MRWIDLDTGGRIGQVPATGKCMIVVPATYGDNCDTWNFLWGYAKEPTGTHKGTLEEACRACEAAFLIEHGQGVQV